MFGPKANIGIGREMEDHVAAGHGGSERWRIEQVAAMQGEAGIFDGIGQKGFEAGRKIIVADDAVTTGQQGIH